MLHCSGTLKTVKRGLIAIHYCCRITLCSATDTKICHYKNQVNIKKNQEKRDYEIWSLWSLYVMEELCQDFPSSADCLLVILAWTCPFLYAVYKNTGCSVFCGQHLLIFPELTGYKHFSKWSQWWSCKNKQLCWVKIWGMFVYKLIGFAPLMCTRCLKCVINACQQNKEKHIPTHTYRKKHTNAPWIY